MDRSKERPETEFPRFTSPCVRKKNIRLLEFQALHFWQITLLSPDLHTPGISSRNSRDEQSSTRLSSDGPPAASHELQTIGRSAYHFTLIGYSNFWSSYTAFGNMWHIATLGNFGRYGSVIVATRRRGYAQIGSKLDFDDGWIKPFVQLHKSAFYFNLGSDASGQAISIYTARATEPRGLRGPLHRGAFRSKGETVYVEQIDIMSFTKTSSCFFLPKGEYEVSCFPADERKRRDVYSRLIEDQMKNAHHQIVFTQK
jgi:hypothetical protein